MRNSEKEYPAGKKDGRARPVAPEVTRMDWPLVARGAGTGFSVLLITGLLTPLLVLYEPSLASAWLVAATLAGFAAAGWRTRTAAVPALNGAAGGAIAYLLTVPMLLLQHQPFRLAEVVPVVASGLVVGGAVSWAAARRVRSRRQRRSPHGGSHTPPAVDVS